MIQTELISAIFIFIGVTIPVYLRLNLKNTHMRKLTIILAIFILADGNLLFCRRLSTCQYALAKIAIFFAGC
jgi:hypothetical protein